MDGDDCTICIAYSMSAVSVPGPGLFASEIPADAGIGSHSINRLTQDPFISKGHIHI